ncbi:MAG TPA: ribosome biogenesis GTPase RsgA, partial [Alcanivorax sp.]|nr:ribosome biogenesis GTPase RsgA [Alcanivorax sp.]
PATLVLNKADLIDAESRDALDHITDIYRDLDYPVIEASAEDGAGLAALKTALTGHTCAFVGQSGVGKSSLVNAVLPGAELAVGDLSGVSGLGQHTTTTARLFRLP